MALFEDSSHFNTFLCKYFIVVVVVEIKLISINLLVVYRESVNLIGYITRRLSADSQ